MANGGGTGEEGRSWTAANAASLTARLAGEAALAADLAEKVAHVGTVVAREFALAAVCDVVLDETIHTLGAQLVTLHLANEPQQLLKLLGQRRIPADLVGRASQMPLDPSEPTARAAASRQVQIISGRHQLDPAARIARELLSRLDCETMVALPLVAHDRLVAVLTFALADEHTFSTGERATLDSCSHVFSFAIAHAMLYEGERRLRALFEAVGRASVAIVSELELEPSLQNIVDEARRIADAEYAALGIVASPEEAFDPWVFSGMTREQEARIGRHPRPVGILGMVGETECPVRVADVRQHPAFRGLPPHHPEISSFLGVPIRFGGRALGNLYLANKRSDDSFSKEDQKAIELLAAQAGAVVHHRRLRVELDAERARFKAIVECAPYGVVFVDPRSGFVLANARAAELAGDIFLPGGGHRGEMLAPDGTAISLDERPLERALRGETVKPQEFLFRHPDGREMPVLVSAAPVRALGPQGTVVLFEDISPLKVPERLRQEWASIVIHELRQPLTVLDASVDLLRMMPGLERDDLRRIIGRVHRAAKSLGRLIDDMADASRIESRLLGLNLQPVQLDVLARAIIEEQQTRNPDRVLMLQLPRRVPAIEADSVRIEQVISNLLTNALKYSTPATPIDVEVRVDEGEVRVLVTNHGPGIAAEDLSQVFDRFYRAPQARRTEKRGLGLGLYVAKGIVEAHGGRIWAESRPGDTTTFQFALPTSRNSSRRANGTVVQGDDH